MSASPAEAAAPNWAEIATEPRCPLCEYMLRGLATPRCPECGYRFSWAEVLDASRRDHPYLFEHHPERNIWSFFKTMVGAMRPQRFWSLLHPSQYGSSHRLIIYWAWSLLTFVVVVVSAPVIQSMVLNGVALFHYRSRLAQLQLPWLQTYLDEIVQDLQTVYREENLKVFVFTFFVAMVWPVLTYSALQIFDVSMRKARVKRIHVLRCVIYGLDIWLLTCVWSAIVFAALLLRVVELLSSSRFGHPQLESVIAPAVAFTILVQTYRLGIAYKRYLRFDHPMSVAVSAQVIAALSMLIIVFYTIWY